MLLIGGSDKDLGLCFGIGTAGYIISCLFIGHHLDRFNPKHILQFGSFALCAVVLGVYLIVWLSVRDSLSVHPVPVVLVMNIILSVLLALFWPPMMGWLSTDHEGPALTKRLGVFNLSWSLALVVSPLLGGFIVKIDSNLAVLTAALFMGFTFVSVSIAPTPSHRIQNESSKERLSVATSAVNHPHHALFRNMARSALVTSCITIALLRTQFAIFFTEELGFSKVRFGMLTTLLCLATFAGFYATGKTARWHHRFGLFFLAQIIIVLAMMLIFLWPFLWVLCIAVVLTGVGQSFIYASHQYYAVSGQQQRSGAMAVHESLISVGYVVGGVTGGYLAEYLSRYAPYAFGAGMVFIAIVTQLILFYLYRKKLN
jgi:MFS family permease